MNAMIAILKRELAHFFTSPIAYVVLVIFSLLGGWFYVMGYLFPFAQYCEQYPIIQMQMQRNPMLSQNLPIPNYTELIVPGVFATLSIILVFLIPILTMRSIAEEKKQGTIELLYTYPVSDLQVVMGKYLASLAVFSLMVLLVLFYIKLPDLFLGADGIVEWKPTLSALLGFFLLGASSIAIGFIFSSLTENQIVSAALTFAVLLFLWVVGWAAQSENLPDQWRMIAETVSLTNRSQSLYKGLIKLSDLVFFVSVTVGALFITMRSLESHRWRA